MARGTLTQEGSLWLWGRDQISPPISQAASGSTDHPVVLAEGWQHLPGMHRLLRPHPTLPSRPAHY